MESEAPEYGFYSNVNHMFLILMGQREKDREFEKEYFI